MTISVVIPVHNSMGSLVELVERLHISLNSIEGNFEIILVEDGSQDDSWVLIQELAKEYPYLRGLKLSRNFGQHNAISAGLVQADGEWIVVMDDDLQDRPEEIGNLLNLALEGYDLILARRIDRQDSLFKRLTSKAFNAIFGYLTDTKQDHLEGNFGVYHRKVIKSVLSMGDSARVFPMLIQWVGFRKAHLDVPHSKRSDSTSNYTIRKLTVLAIDIIISFTEKPLRIALQVGLFMALGSILLSILFAILYLQGFDFPKGYTSLIMTILFSTGLLLSFLGLIGLYVGKIAQQTKNRPSYLITESINVVEREY